jgi:hypothetical protein
VKFECSQVPDAGILSQSPVAVKTGDKFKFLDAETLFNILRIGPQSIHFQMRYSESQGQRVYNICTLTLRLENDSLRQYIS